MPEQMPVVTVVIPAYNHAPYIEECVESILAERYPALDLIVINDGSTDSTLEKIEGLTKRHPGAFRYVDKKNEGLAKTLNLGLSMAKGSYFAELASDDSLIPGSIVKRVEFLEKNPGIDAVFADCLLMYGNEKTNKRLIKDSGKTGHRSPVHGLVDYISKATEIFFPTGMIRTDTLRRLGGFDEDFRYCEDMLMRYVLTLKTKIEYIDEPVMNYRRHPSNVSGSPLRIVPEKILALDKLTRMTDDPAVKRWIDKRLFKYNVAYFRDGIKAGMDREKLKPYIRRAREMRPWSLKALYLRLLLAF
ncbi:MAG: glycosyltransferase [Deltaproteobacteria bacterium]|nr:glycosyltransferase [Deltaproteobacteria bacterium]